MKSLVKIWFNPSFTLKPTHALLFLLGVPGTIFTLCSFHLDPALAQELGVASFRARNFQALRGTLLMIAGMLAAISISALFPILFEGMQTAQFGAFDHASLFLWAVSNDADEKACV
ncbi:MAG TPA: hypothetical protein VFO10_14605 [Oligoflexus sp.]|uniref:hypothetical protein n=1 Tax=Oligoflexus sp. TaxID=1971216 RepID=UPI002D7ED2A9|nr:hypothetical protein [Oligoflexus sp.]HET9238488.1 hypothetical protein [Oligoflexus sp.]